MRNMRSKYVSIDASKLHSWSKNLEGVIGWPENIRNTCDLAEWWVWVSFRIRRCHPIESWIGQLVETYAQLLPRYPFISPFSLCALFSPSDAGFRDCYATRALCSLWNHEATLAALTLEPLLGETMRRFSCSSGRERERVVCPSSPLLSSVLRLTL